ncbi:3-deoxy-7-phosphoheptulonate synthase [Salinisphaera japonica]|uniref:Phospho-2-dehydro-3-deoxyheptonate aldolase n=1 Tax=Salinisphaera japonica YTM-1 TaxID=1209778 RepID=A0A423PWU6_9GAMM|nr:3-deoxy-7-phosphoheptulonate synthase [Salinisphaera japonica]ROO30080.1 phospho-2-dehydro-3-deoxyheptonate aldolase [Salinisphaera japonica YTM-1]
MKHETDNLRIQGIQELVSPETLLTELPVSEAAATTVYEARGAMQNVLSGNDDRLVVVVGPCSIHDVDAALEYAERLAELRERYADDLIIVMRVYFEKPRTTVGWKGLINDPDLDDSFQINKGIRQARKLLADLAERGMPAGVEFLDLITPQYLADLVAWGAIGARTTESQGHRELASGLSCPVGFKNGTGGSIKIAVDAVGAARHSHHFLSLTKEGQSAIFQTAGNADSHVILRGGANGPNFDADAVAGAIAQLGQADLPGYVMIDFSHANSRKQHKKQLEVGDDVGGQIAAGSKAVFGVMIESHLKEGAQKLVPGMAPEYGVSITDACLGWEDTEKLLGDLAHAVSERRGLGDSSDTD